MSLAEIDHAFRKAEMLGVTVVAATGYGCPEFGSTFQRHGNVLMVGGVNQEGNPVGIPKGGRVDIFAPGDSIVVPSSRFGNRTQVKFSSNSFAAPFIAAACAVASQRFRTAKEVRQAVLDSGATEKGMKIVDFKGLVERLYSQTQQ